MTMVKKIIQQAEAGANNCRLSEQDANVARAIVGARWGLMSFREASRPGSGSRCRQVDYKKLGLTYDACVASIGAIKEALSIPNDEITCTHAHGLCRLVFHEPSREPTIPALDHDKERGYYAYTVALLDQIKAIVVTEKGQNGR